MFRRFIDTQVSRVRSCPQAGRLGEEVYKRLEASLNRKVAVITKNTVTHLISQAAENPFAATIPALLTEDEKTAALARVRRQLDSGAMSLPKPLVDCLELQLQNATGAFIEALVRMEENRQAICAGLTGGKLYQTIEDVTFSVGDTHNQGRSVTIFYTDAGNVVYKPHDLRIDKQLYAFAKEFFPEFVGIPRSVACGDGFGFCEFITKRRAEGEEEAKRFWYSLGGLAAFAKLMGSVDLHYENILCCGTKPYIVDLETVAMPVASEQASYVQSAESKEYILRSPAASLLMPNRVGDLEFSALMNVEEDGVAPLVDGKPVTVRAYLEAYKGGYHAAYSRAIERRNEIAQALRLFRRDIAIRIVLRPTRGYWEMIKKLYHHTALASEQSWAHNGEVLSQLLHECSSIIPDRVVDSEVKQMQRGDVPYFYTYIDSLALYGEGEKLVENRFGESALGHILGTLFAMDEKDEQFDLEYIDQAIRQYPQVSNEQQNRIIVRREDIADPLPVTVAAKEARAIFDEMYGLRILAPDGNPLWGYVANESQGFELGDHGLFNGLTGITVFASACASLWEDAQVKEKAKALVQETADEIRTAFRYLRGYEDLWDGSISAGEGKGLGGILTGIALIRRYTPGKTADSLCGELLELLDGAEFAGYNEADRIGGLAGLISALCRFEEYRGCQKAIRSAADRLLELKNLDYGGMALWKTLHGIPRALTGAGHGIAGIAEALFAAGDVLGDARYFDAANEALNYERKAYLRYADKFGTWADLRDFPPKTYMHGYCAGAPGTGIMLQRISQKTPGSQKVGELAGYVRQSVDALPLNNLDHLCCGNAAIAEYYLTVGDHGAAGKVLGAMYERKQREGSYREPYNHESGGATASLFNGISGVGYEMLRYAYPQRILSIV